MLSNPVSRFLLVSRCEGVSFLALLLLGSVLSRVSDINLVMPLGIIHGLLFVAYVLLMLDMRTKFGWDGKTTGLAFLASVLPFGPFVFEAKMKDRIFTAPVAPSAA
ncbi:DUF3817 domain-containing protein [Streptodolium elevatio]|uniref:DUF3817 domain-containing protein n=1 Tax=Streptodolium elevatio TaxID=3157996 RepID=A0ABV3DDN0_9ACTN